MFFIRIFSIILVFYVHYGCYDKKIANNDNVIDIWVDVKEMDVWINLMPGTEKPKIYLSGNFDLENRMNNSIDKLEFKSIEIVQNDSTIYSLNQKTINGVFSNKTVLPKNKTNFMFSTNDGLIIQNINIDLPIIIKTKFMLNDANFEYMVDSVKIERVY